MSANANILDLVKGNSTLVRPLFSPGLLLRDDDLRAGVDYTRELSRLLTRSLFGCGVVCGLEVTAALRCGKVVVTVERGLALSCIGDPIHVPKEKTLSIDETCGKELPPTLWVTLCRTDKCCAPRTAACACDDEDAGSVCTREQEGYEIRIVKDEPKDCICKERPLPNPERVPPKSECWCANPCQDCHRDHYEGRCACKCCDCECLVLAVLKRSLEEQGGTGGGPAPGEPGGAAEVKWIVNHSVRRFVRPVLMRDPVVHEEQYPDDEPCNGKAVETTDDRQQHAMANNIAAADEAAKRAALATSSALRKGAETSAAVAAGNIVKAEAAAKAVAEMAVEAEMSAKAVAEKAAEAAVTARREVEKMTAEREVAEKALAKKLAAENVGAVRIAAAATPPATVDKAAPAASTGVKRSGTRSRGKTLPVKPEAS